MPLRLFLCSMILLGLTACAGMRMPDRSLPPLGRVMPDSVFVHHWPPDSQADSLFVIQKMPRRSLGSSADYLRVWRTSFEDEARRQGMKVIWPAAGLGAADTGWPALPGSASWVLVPLGFELQGVNRGGIGSFFAWLGVSQPARREYGWLKSRFRFEATTGAVLWEDSLLSRRPDGKYTLNRTDRAGLLATQAAKDLVQVLREGIEPAPPRESEE